MAGSRYQYSIPAASLRLKERRIPVRPAVLFKDEKIREIARTRAERTAGNLDRTPTMWKMLAGEPEEPVYTYLIGTQEKTDGYLVFQQDKAPGGYNVRVRDMAALSYESIRRLWSFLATHAAQSREIRWSGPAVEPLLWPLPEPFPKVVYPEFWMLRIVNASRSLELRGYPKEVTAELHLEIEDDCIEVNNGRIVLHVADGTAQTKEGGSGDLRISIRHLAALYSGLLDPWQLRDAGKIEGSAESLSTAARVFAGPEPWMPDNF
jgi:predicted acetyltransferase